MKKTKKTNKDVEDEDEKGRRFTLTVRCSTTKFFDHFQHKTKKIPPLEYESFRNSPFGQFLDFKSEDVHIITSVITEIVKCRVGRLKYGIAGRVLEFKMSDVALLLGPLKFRKVPVKFLMRKPKEYSAFRSKYFGTNLHIRDDHILLTITEAIQGDQFLREKQIQIMFII